MKQQQPWYKHDPKDFLEGVHGLGAGQIGVYIVILDLIYQRGGKCPNDPQYIGGICGESWQKTNFLIRALLDAGKIRVDSDGQLYNARATRVLSARSVGSQSGGAPDLSGRQTPHKPPLHPPGDPPHPTPGSHKIGRAEINGLPKQIKKEDTETDSTSESVSTDSTPSNTSPDFTNPPVAPQGGKATNEGKKSSSSKRTLIGDWVPTDEDKRKAVKYWRAHGREDLIQRGRHVVAQFLANHRSRGTRMADWPSAWETWYVRELATAPLRGTGQPAAISRNYRADAEGFEVMRDEDWLLALRMFYGLDGGEAGVWLRDRRGPAPGEPGCRVKQELIDKVKPRNAA